MTSTGTESGTPKRERYRHGDLSRALLEAGTELARGGEQDALPAASRRLGRARRGRCAARRASPARRVPGLVGGPRPGDAAHRRSPAGPRRLAGVRRRATSAGHGRTGFVADRILGIGDGTDLSYRRVQLDRQVGEKWKASLFCNPPLQPSVALLLASCVALGLPARDGAGWKISSASW